MLRSRFAVAMLSAFALVAPLAAQDKPIKLELKFEKGKTFYQDMTTETIQDMDVMGMKINQTQKQTFIFSWNPVEFNDKDKTWKVKQKIEGVKIEIQIAGNTISFDSTKETGSGGNPVADFFKALVGAEFTLTIDKDLKVTKVEGRDVFLQKLNAANPQMQQLLTQILSDDALKQMSDPAFSVVPGKEVKKGDTWEKTSKLNMGPIGSYDTTYKYTFDGIDEKDKAAKIKVNTTLKYSPPQAGGGAGLPFKISKAELTSKEASGTILFDTTKGRVQSADLKMDLDGTLTIEVGGMTSEVKLAQKQKTTMKASDDNPVKKAGS